MKNNLFLRKKGKNLFFNSANSFFIFLNVLFFFSFLIIFREKLFLEGGFLWKNIALSSSNFLENRFWTVLTSMFMHGSFFHLFANMFSLFFIGSLIEKIIGKKRYIIFYLSSGIFAGLFYLFLESFFGSGLPAVGASGALFGLVGLLVLLTPDLPVFVMFIPIPIKIKYAGPGILILLWLISILGDIPIGNTAHLGGLLVGLFYGIYLKRKYKRKTKYIRKMFS